MYIIHQFEQADANTVYESYFSKDNWVLCKTVKSSNTFTRSYYPVPASESYATAWAARASKTYATANLGNADIPAHSIYLWSKQDDIVAAVTP